MKNTGGIYWCWPKSYSNADGAARRIDWILLLLIGTKQPSEGLPLTPWCRVLLEKLTGLQLVKKFPAFHGTRRFITALTSVRHLSLSWANPFQSIYPHPTSWRSVLILSTHLRLGLPSGLLPSGFPTKTLYTHSPHPYAPHAQPISFFLILRDCHYRIKKWPLCSETVPGQRNVAHPAVVRK